MAAIFKIVISPYLSEKSSDFDDILYTAADFELDECHIIKNEKVALDRLPSSTERISYIDVNLTSFIRLQMTMLKLHKIQCLNFRIFEGFVWIYEKMFF